MKLLHMNNESFVDSLSISRKMDRNVNGVNALE